MTMRRAAEEPGNPVRRNCSRSLMTMKGQTDVLIEQRPIETAVLNRLEEVFPLDSIDTGQIGNRAGNLENPIVRAGGKRKLFHRLLQQVALR